MKKTMTYNTAYAAKRRRLSNHPRASRDNRISPRRTLKFLGVRSPIPAILLAVGVVVVIIGFMISNYQMEQSTPSQRYVNPQPNGDVKPLQNTD